MEKIFALIGNFALNEFLGGNLKFALIEIALIEVRTNRGIAVKAKLTTIQQRTSVKKLRQNLSQYFVMFRNGPTE